MNPKLISGLALVLACVLAGCSTTVQSASLVTTPAGNNLTRQISGILIECQKIKPGMTRAQLMEVFATEGGLSTAEDRTFVYRACPYIKVDVDFKLSAPGQNVLNEQPADIISKISKPYLEWSISD